MRTRRFVFAGGPELRFPPVTHWTINGSDFQVDRPVATPRYGDVEIWHFENRKRLGFLGLVHPVHVHLVNFQGDRTRWRPTAAPRDWLEGYGRHNLEHEDHAMMARFDVL
jgi:FtsP/CotA-like multicopper oxidase with cupredoxin domain